MKPLKERYPEREGITSKRLTDSMHEAEKIARTLGPVVQLRLKFLKKLQDKVPRESIFVMYHPSETKLFIFLVTADRFRVEVVSVARDTLYAMIRQYRSLISSDIAKARQTKIMPLIDSWQDGAIRPMREVMVRLYQYLIQPVEKDLVRKKILTFIPSGLLYYLPIHSLARETPDGGLDFVIERWKVNYLSSIGFLDIAEARGRLRRRASFQHIVALANSDGTLPRTEEEVRMVKVFVPNDVKVEIYVRAQATEELAVQKSQTCSVLILATHCFLDSRNPYQTSIKLAPSGNFDGDWQVKEIQEILCPNLNLVILSACATAIGEENPGVEVCNLVESFGTAGASSIIATLWPVSDLSSKELMSYFYRGILKLGLSKVEALRQAQLALLSDPRFRHPALWAPFVLFGDWR